MLLFFATLPMLGCRGPIGPGCTDLGCNSCNGEIPARLCVNGPIDVLRNVKQRITCGSGCGEVYQGEWISTPPHAADPCCDGQFVGGATHCRPFCWQPRQLLRRLFGRRFCTGIQSSTPCGCGDEIISSGCSSCDAGFVSEEYIGGGILDTAVPTGSCSTCSASHSPASSTRVAAQPRQLQRAERIVSPGSTTVRR